MCNLSQYEDAIRQFNKAITLKPKNECKFAFINRGICLKNLKKFNDAI